MRCADAGVVVFEPRTVWGFEWAMREKGDDKGPSGELHCLRCCLQATSAARASPGRPPVEPNASRSGHRWSKCRRWAGAVRTTDRSSSSAPLEPTRTHSNLERGPCDLVGGSFQGLSVHRLCLLHSRWVADLSHQHHDGHTVSQVTKGALDSQKVPRPI